MKKPERHDFPTPNGGAYAIAYFHADGSIAEIVEFTADDRELQRTYCEPPATTTDQVDRKDLP